MHFCLALPRASRSKAWCGCCRTLSGFGTRAAAAKGAVGAVSAGVSAGFRMFTLGTVRLSALGWMLFCPPRTLSKGSGSRPRGSGGLSSAPDLSFTGLWAKPV